MATLIERADVRLLTFRLPQTVGGSGVAMVDVIIVELEDSDGVTGLGFSYVLGGGGQLAAQAAAEQLQRFVTKQALVPPRALWKTVVRSFNRTGLGPNLIGLAAIDTACWDLYARRQQLPLGVAMGGQLRPTPVYGSGGYNTQQSPGEAAAVAMAHVARGLRAVKPRVAGVPKDASVISAVRAAVDDAADVMADANEKCDLVSAQRLLAVARDFGLLFVEEPLPSQALSGFRSLKQMSSVALAGGEHCQETALLAALMSDRIISVVQPDLAMIGGLTPVLELAVVAEALDVVVSPHFLPGLFAHVAAAASSVRWLEEFPLLEPLFEGWPAVRPDGTMRASDAPGHGLQLSEQALTFLREQG